ncbi:hypothetical protein [Aurantiacibacter gilvus]|uniref:Uncharacterized protein n=1 Tax=Aurantiacibacter gilvus TaxID=3139141 RepID=A0ABU9IAV9_9SPHN
MAKLKWSGKVASERRLFLWCAIWMTAVSVIGFLPPTIARFALPEEIGYVTQDVAFHGITTSLWVLVYLTQTILIRKRNPAIHRKVGLFATILLGLVLYSGFHMLLAMFTSGDKDLAEAAFNILGIGTAVALAAAGIAMRKVSYWHKRLMLAGTVILTRASTSRSIGMVEMASGQQLELNFYGLQAIVGAPLIALVIHDWLVHRRLVPALVVASPFVATSVLYVHRPLLVHDTGEALLRTLAPIFWV